MNTMRLAAMLFFMTGFFTQEFVFAADRGDYVDRASAAPDRRADQRPPLPPKTPMPQTSPPPPFREDTRSTPGGGHNTHIDPQTPKARGGSGSSVHGTPPAKSRSLLSLAPEGTPKALQIYRDPSVVATAAATGVSPQIRTRSVQLVDSFDEPLVELDQDFSASRRRSAAGVSSTTPSQRRSGSKTTPPPPLSAIDLLAEAADYDVAELELRASSTAPSHGMTLLEYPDFPEEFALPPNQAAAAAAQASPELRQEAVVLSKNDAKLKAEVALIVRSAHTMNSGEMCDRVISLVNGLKTRFMNTFEVLLMQIDPDVDWGHVFVMGMKEQSGGDGRTYGSFKDMGGHYFHVYKKFEEVGLIRFEVLNDMIDDQPLQIRVYNLIYPNEIFQKTLFPVNWEWQKIAEVIHEAIAAARKDLGRVVADKGLFTYTHRFHGLTLKIVAGDPTLSEIVSVYPVYPRLNSATTTPVLRASARPGSASVTGTPVRDLNASVTSAGAASAGGGTPRGSFARRPSTYASTPTSAKSVDRTSAAAASVGTPKLQFYKK